MRLTLHALVTITLSTGGMAAGPDASIPIDLLAGKLSQTNCQTAIGCGHAQVARTATELVSVSTNRSAAQHILILAIGDAWPVDKSLEGPHRIELEYELFNPSGHANNVICVKVGSAADAQGGCAQGVTGAGQLQVPLSTDTPGTIELRFGLMPFSVGHRFAVRNVRITEGHVKDEQVNGTERTAIDLTRGRLRQAGCQTPIGCDHKKVTLTPTTFSSSADAKPNQPPSDDPNGPPPAAPAAAPLSLEIPVNDVSKGHRSLRFSYRLESANAQAPGRILLTAITNESVVQSVITSNGSGEAAFELPPSTPRVDNVRVTFDPPADGGAAFYELSGVSFGAGIPSGDALPIEIGTTCDSCHPPASRLDPCGPHLTTFFVEGADGRRGRGIRCVSPGLRAWYGEDWWTDF